MEAPEAVELGSLLDGGKELAPLASFPLVAAAAATAAAILLPLLAILLWRLLPRVSCRFPASICGIGPVLCAPFLCGRTGPHRSPSAAHAPLALPACAPPLRADATHACPPPFETPLLLLTPPPLPPPSPCVAPWPSPRRDGPRPRC